MLEDAPGALPFARCQWGEGSAEELLPWRSPQQCSWLGCCRDTVLIFPELLLLLPSDPSISDRWDPGSAGPCPKAHSSRCEYLGAGPPHCWVAQVTLHWMLRLRYCTNMLASWGRFSSLGCILV